MAFLVLAFPIISEDDFNWIQSYRKANDKLFYDVVNPHFTIVFPTTDLTETIFVDEIYLQAKGLETIEFEINKAILNKDAFSDYYHEFLVPQKGFDDIVKFHDKLYSGKLLPNLRNDIEYIPHIGIGKSKDMNISKRRLDDLNIPTIRGQINELIIANYENNIVSEITSIKLL